MKQQIGQLAILVRDYDEAIGYYTRKLGFELKEDVAQTPTKRWVVVAPPGGAGTSLLLARAATPEQERCIGNQAGGRVFLFLESDDFWRDYRAMQARAVHFLEQPRNEAYGTVAVFQDLYGNKWDLLESFPEPT